MSSVLKSAVKSGVQQLNHYYHEKEANTPLSETREEDLEGTTDVNHPGGQTTTMASEDKTPEVKSAPTHFGPYSRAMT